jgi:pyridoxine 4-dehydrogenase
MIDNTLPGGTFTLAPGIIVNRMGYGAMQLAGPGVFGPPKDHDAAIAVLHEAMRIGINHLDTSDFYGPHVTSEAPRASARGFILVQAALAHCLLCPAVRYRPE